MYANLAAVSFRALSSASTARPRGNLQTVLRITTRFVLTGLLSSLQFPKDMKMYGPMQFGESSLQPLDIRYVDASTQSKIIVR